MISSNHNHFIELQRLEFTFHLYVLSRVVGGLVSAHILAEYLKGPGYMSWYQGQLLNMALDVGNRLLPAFNSTTGLPHPRSGH